MDLRKLITTHGHIILTIPTLAAHHHINKMIKDQLDVAYLVSPYLARPYPIYYHLYHWGRGYQYGWTDDDGSFYRRRQPTAPFIPYTPTIYRRAQ